MLAMMSEGNHTRGFIETILRANGINITEDILERVMRMRKIPENHTFDEDECGGRFKSAADIYAETYHSYFAVFICVFGIIANCLNILVLTKKDMAATPINRILTALAYADVLLMIEYIPFTVYDELDSRQKKLTYYGAVYVLFHIHVTQILHTTSVCLTLTLAIWRFVAIRFMQKSHILCSHERCTKAIIICIISPPFFCLPQFLTFKVEKVMITEQNTTTHLYRVGLSELVAHNITFLRLNFWIYSIFSKLLPCVMLIIISIWLIRTLFNAKKSRQVLKGNNNQKSKYERRADRTTKMLVAILFLFLLTELPQGLFALVIGLRGKKVFLTCYQYYGEVMDIMALLNGSINFILYCYMNRMFRITFGQLFKKKLCTWVKSQRSEVLELSAPTAKVATTMV